MKLKDLNPFTRIYAAIKTADAAIHELNRLITNFVTLSAHARLCDAVNQIDKKLHERTTILVEKLNDLSAAQSRIDFLVTRMDNVEITANGAAKASDVANLRLSLFSEIGRTDGVIVRVDGLVTRVNRLENATTAPITEAPAKAATLVQNGKMTPNAARKVLGLDPMSDGENLVSVKAVKAAKTMKPRAPKGGSN